MFDFLKKKITDFTDKLKEKLEQKKEEAQATPQEPIAQKTPETKIVEKKEPAAKAEPAAFEKTPIQKQIIPKKKEEKKETEKKIPEKEPEKIIQEEGEEFDIAGEKKSAIEKITQVRQEEKRELKAHEGIGKKILGVLGAKIKISKDDIGDFFDEFELSLLESDVEQEAAQAIVQELGQSLVGKEISARENLSEFLKKEVKSAIAKVMDAPKIDILRTGKKPVKILFLGPNGAGKTTTIAKVAKYFLDHKKTALLAAGDTFRAASIEQLEEHAKLVGVKVVKHKYGADPAAVAYDAVKAAEAKGIDAVLIDSAGRQETNKNLIEELKKIDRVVKPDLKIYVGEAYTGQALLQQATEFDKAIGIDGFILTKIDADTKGGTAISLIYKLKKPVIFVGTGQRYSDLLEFEPEFIINRIL
ncbi:MAG: signal recognition particle-docking protein FtsY [archaeon]|nr:signal recognition particle-docking protein FtsY [archaeon]